MSQPKAATKVGGVRHKGHKNTQKPKPKEEVQPPIDPLLNTQPVIQGQPQPKGSPKHKPQQNYAAQKAPPAKFQKNNKKQNNPNINQPKQGY